MKMKRYSTTKLSWLTLSVITLFLSCSTRSTNRESIDFDNPATDKSDRIQVIVKKAENRVDILYDGEVFTSYIFPQSAKKPVLYPISTANGTRITRGFPYVKVAGERVDHPHHLGMWMNYGHVNGLDFWNNSDSIKADRRDHYGTIYHKEFVSSVNGNDIGELKVKAEWKAPDATVLLDETTEYLFSGYGNERIIDRITRLKAVNGKVNFRDNKEGFFAIRVTRALEHPSDKPEIFTDTNGKSTGVPVLNNDGVTGRYYNSEGVEGTDCWGKRAKWVNLYGMIENEGINLIILDHPDNVGYPAYWHARGYGLFSVNTLGQGPLSNGKDILDFKLEDGESVTFKYRVIINSGDRLSKDAIDQRFKEFSKRSDR
ncbi:PmoA family protein [Bacteroidota bacterium]